VIADYLAQLRRELQTVGIRGRLLWRILAESEDHLRSDPAAEARFGSPGEVANTFAAELGARASRRAAVSAFLALAVAGAVFGASFVGASFAGQPAPDTWPLLALVAFGSAIVAAQVAFVAGSLALVRALRRRDRLLPSAELDVLNRRTGLALAFGVVTMCALVLFAIELRHGFAAWWVTMTLAGAALAVSLLLLAGLPSVGAVRLSPRVAGEAGDVFDDLGFGRTEPWRFARRIALGLGLVVFLVAAAQGDPLDGALNGLAEALACLGGFAAFGRYLGLRR
jgi:hypothetical protein